jgi:hypothetical protein
MPGTITHPFSFACSGANSVTNNELCCIVQYWSGLKENKDAKDDGHRGESLQKSRRL